MLKIFRWYAPFLLFACVSSKLFTDEDNAHLPRLFVLDEYERCLSRQEGLYCLGVFQLTPLGNSTVYRRIQEYSSRPFAFNRSRLHRGYCVSARCPSRERNATRRFERCVSERARSHALSARLHTLHHCTTHAQHVNKQPLDALQLLFLQIICAVLVLNFIGTVYDVFGGDNGKKTGLIVAWSVRASWRRLTAVADGGHPHLQELKPLHGFRVIILLISIYAHTRCYHGQYFSTTPHFAENLFLRSEGILLSNGSVQVFVVITSFLTGYSLLLYSQNKELRLAMLPVLIMKRISRIAPVHLLLIGFTATWWPVFLSGPFHSFAEKESAICRRKFWSHVFFYNNLVDKWNHCITPTWFFAVDMHLYILSCVLVIITYHRRQLARRLFAACFIISSVACGVVSYVTGWQAMLHFNEPEILLGVFSKVESFGEFYISTWGSLPACFFGLYMAYIYSDLRESNYHKNKWIRLLHHLSYPLVYFWVTAAVSLVHGDRRRAVTAMFVVLDRPLTLVGVFLLCLILMVKIRGPWRTLYSWSGWRVPARLALPVNLCHWLIIGYIAARPVAYYTSVFYLVIDYLATVVFSFLIAVPVSILVEIPTQKFISELI